ncbi:MAG: hypothetical protein CMK59_03545 [Proteobacteria bacterium]|nr:hypothetical protein [Pseudomonadota bacterium]
MYEYVVPLQLFHEVDIRVIQIEFSLLIGEAYAVKDYHYTMFLFVMLSLGCSYERDFNLASDALREHDLAAAEKYFLSALKKNSDHLPSLNGLGWTYHLAGEEEAAAESFSRCLSIDPVFLECLRGQASLALKSGNTRAARKLLEQGVSLYPEDAKLQSSLALLELTEGNNYAAEERYRSLARRFPNRAEYQLGLGEALFRKGESQATLELTERALKIPNTPVRYKSMLWVLRARSIISEIAGKEENNCAAAPAVAVWIEAAQKALLEAQSTGVQMPELPVIKRQVAKRETILQENCPKVQFKK